MWSLLEDILAFTVRFLIVLVIIPIMGIIVAIPLMILWNWLMPTIFHLPEINFWQAWGLVFLSSILFKNNSSTK